MKDIKKTKAQLKVLTKTTLILTSKFNLTDVLKETFQQIKRLVNYSACSISFIDKGQISNIYSIGHDKYGSESFVNSFTYSLEKLPLEKETVKKATSLLISDTHKDSRWIIFKETSWIRSRLSIPLCVKDRVIGLLNLDSHVPDKFKKDDIKKLQPLANVATLALENIQLFEKLQGALTEQKQIEKALTESEEKYRTIFENSGTAMIIIEEDATISMANKECEKLSGYSREEIENKMKWTEFVVPEDLERMKKYHIERRKAEAIAPTKYEFRLIDKKGRVKDIFLRIGIISGTKKTVASLTDITKHKQTEEKMKHLNLILRAIRKVNQLIVKEKNRERLLPGACNNLIETRGYHGAWIVLLDQEGRLETYAEAGLGKRAFLPMVKLLEQGKFPLCAQKALKQQKVIIIEDPISTCRVCPLAKLYSNHKVMTIRLEHHQKVYGFISVSIPTQLASDQKEQSLFKEVAGDIAFALHGIILDKEYKQAEERLQKTHQRLQKTMNTTIDTMSKIIEVKDPYTSGHQQRASQLAVRIAQELKLPEDKMEGIRIASLIHDIGKIGLPTEILTKPTKLSDIELNLIKGHSQIGYDILKSIDFLYPIAQIVLQHHERLNGSGYPQGLKDGEILLEARIIGVADVVEAMSSHRPYRPALGTDKALEEISQNKGILYDSEVADICLKLFREKGFKFE